MRPGIAESPWKGDGKVKRESRIYTRKSHFGTLKSWEYELLCSKGRTTKTGKGTSLVVQWLKLHDPNAGGPGMIPGQGTRYCMPQLKIRMPEQRSHMQQRRSYVLQLRPSVAK